MFLFLFLFYKLFLNIFLVMLLKKLFKYHYQEGNAKVKIKGIEKMDISGYTHKDSCKFTKTNIAKNLYPETVNCKYVKTLQQLSFPSSRQIIFYF